MATKNSDFKNNAVKNNKALAKKIGDKARQRAEETNRRRRLKLNRMNADLQKMKQLYVQNHPEEENKEGVYPCKICSEPLFEDCTKELHSINSCTDVFHKECLIHYLSIQIE